MGNQEIRYNNIMYVRACGGVAESFCMDLGVCSDSLVS